MESIGDRVKILRGDHSREKFAALTDVSKNTLANYETSVSTPDALYLNKLLDLLPEVSPAWLLRGEGTMKRGELSVVGGEVAGAPVYSIDGHHETPNGYTRLPRYEVAASAGAGTLVQGEQIVDYVSFKTDWLKIGLGVSPQKAVLISVKGDSMEPTLSNGDLVLIDTSISRVEDNAIYVINYDDALLVKRIQRKYDRSVMIMSDNKSYGDEAVQGSLVDQLNVIGRVVWYGRRA